MRGGAPRARDARWRRGGATLEIVHCVSRVPTIKQGCRCRPRSPRAGRARARTRTSRDPVKSFPKAPSPRAGDFLTSGPGFARTFHGHRLPRIGLCWSRGPRSQQGAAGAARWATPGRAPAGFREVLKGASQDPGGRSAPSPQPGRATALSGLRSCPPRGDPNLWRRILVLCWRPGPPPRGSARWAPREHADRRRAQAEMLDTGSPRGNAN